MHSDDVRARFEAWHKETFGHLCRSFQLLEARWEGYRAAHADLAAEVRESYTPFPQMPSGLVIDPKLGPLFDRMQMQSYAMKFLDAALAKHTHQEKP